MKAAWDWHLPVATREDQEAVVNFAAELGFDTLIAPNPSEEMVDRGRALGLKVISIVYGRPSDTFAEKHPECLQKILSGEERIQKAVAEAAHAAVEAARQGLGPTLIEARTYRSQVRLSFWICLSRFCR